MHLAMKASSIAALPSQQIRRDPSYYRIGVIQHSLGHMTRTDTIAISCSMEAFGLPMIVCLAYSSLRLYA